MSAVDQVAPLASTAQRIYQQCHDCPLDELHCSAPAIRETANTLDDLNDHLVHHPLSRHQIERLDTLLESIAGVLSQIQILLDDQTPEQPSESKLKVTQSHQKTLRKVEIASQEASSKLTSYYTEILRSSEGRIARALHHLVRSGDSERQQCLYKAVRPEEVQTWTELSKEIQEALAISTPIAKHHSFIHRWVYRAIQDGRLAHSTGQQTHRHSIQQEKKPLDKDITVAASDHDSRSLTDEAPSPKSRPKRRSHSNSHEDIPPAENDELVVPDLTTSPSLPSLNHSPIIATKRAEKHNVGLNKRLDPRLQLPDDLERSRTGSVTTATEYDSDDDLFQPPPFEDSLFKVQQSESQEDRQASQVEKKRLSELKMESTVSGPLSLDLFDSSKARAGTTHKVEAVKKSRANREPQRKLSHARSMPDIGKILAEPPPPVPPKEIMSPRLSSRARQSCASSRHSSPRSRSEAEILAATTAKPYAFDLNSTAQLIAEAFSKNKWIEALGLIQNQIDMVGNGAFQLIDGELAQPSVKFLTFLQGVCLSYCGKYSQAKDKFNIVLRSVHTKNFKLNAVEAAAAKWLGDTCILLNQGMDAALAWSVCLGGLIASFGDRDPKAVLLADELRYLNQFTNALNMLKVVGKGFVGSGFNRDPTTVLSDAPASWKRMAILNTLDYCYKHYKPNELPVVDIGRTSEVSTFVLEAWHLRQSVNRFTSFPFDHDPFFEAKSSISLLAALSRPKTDVKVEKITTHSLGRSKSLFFKTDKGARWLIDNLRECLDFNAIEYKIMQNNMLLRLSQTHSRIAYHQCFSIRFRKLPFRNLYGLKMTAVLLSTRSFGEKQSASARSMLMDSRENINEMPPAPERVRAGLMLRINSYLTECAKPRNPGEDVVHELSSDSQLFEMSEITTPIFELPPSDRWSIMTDVRKAWWRRPRKVTEVVPGDNLVELPG